MEAIHATPQHLQALLEASGDGVFTALPAMAAARSVNRAAEQLFGYSREEMVGQDMHALVHQHPVSGAA